MKKYMKPAMTITEIQSATTILAGSGGGVGNGAPVGKQYTETDVTFSRQSPDFWGDED